MLVYVATRMMMMTLSLDTAAWPVATLESSPDMGLNVRAADPQHWTISMNKAERKKEIRRLMRKAVRHTARAARVMVIYLNAPNPSEQRSRLSIYS